MMMMNVPPVFQVDAMVDFRKLVDGLEFEAFPWSEA